VPQPKDPTPGYMMAIMHFSELQLLPSNALREFFVTINDRLWSSSGFRPDYLSSDSMYSTTPLRRSAQYEVFINATANSTLPPFINAIEIFSVISTTNVVTDSSDGTYVLAVADVLEHGNMTIQASVH
jgi:hypothetical protein